MIAFFDSYEVGTFWIARDLSFPMVQKLLESLQAAWRTSTKREPYSGILGANIRRNTIEVQQMSNMFSRDDLEISSPGTDV